MKNIAILVCSVLLMLGAITAHAGEAEKKVVVIPLNTSSKENPGDWKTVSVISLGAVTRSSVYETDQTTGGICGYIVRTATPSMGEGYIVAPIQLPDKATITSFTGLMCDNSNLTNMSMELFRSDGHFLTAVGTHGLGISTTAYKRTTDTINEPVVDNANYAYFIYMSVDGIDAQNAYPISAHITLE